MKYTVEAIKNHFSAKGIDVKQGTIENFRSKLYDLGILGNNQSMTELHLSVFEKIVAEKTDDETWETVMLRHILANLGEFIDRPFKWTEKIIIKNLIWKLEHAQYHVVPFELCSGSEDFHIFCCCIDNFVELGKQYPEYKGSLGTDGNPATSYKIRTEDGRIYYLIGKLNNCTKQEDIHLFYNALPVFDVMSCQHIASGNCDAEPFYSLWQACRKASQNTAEVSLAQSPPVPVVR